LVGLGHLPDFFVEGHFGKQRIDLRIEGGELFGLGCGSGDQAT